ncbi:hypothetical protein ACF1BQ_031400 [Bradyrhizobium sp. RDT10]
MHGLANRYDLSRNLIRIWVQKFEAGALDEAAVAADLVGQYEARIAAAMNSRPRPKSAPTSVIVGPSGLPSRKDAS